MRTKLKLQLEDLAVDSFDTMHAAKPKGTVFGEACTCWTACGQNTCPGCPTCDQTCNGCNPSGAFTCAFTCDDATCVGQVTCNATCQDVTCGCTDTYDNCTTNLVTYCPYNLCN